MVIHKFGGLSWSLEAASTKQLCQGRGLCWSPLLQKAGSKGRTERTSAGGSGGHLRLPEARFTLTPFGVEQWVLDPSSTTPPRPSRLVPWLNNLFLDNPKGQGSSAATLGEERIWVSQAGQTFGPLLTHAHSECPSLYREQSISHR